jgi:hypothetical protein
MWMVARLQVHRLEAGEMLAVQRPNVDDNRLFDMSCLCLYVFASASALSAALLLDFHRKSCGSKLLQRLRLVGFEGCAKRDPRFYEGVAGGKISKANSPQRVFLSRWLKGPQRRSTVFVLLTR